MAAKKKTEDIPAEPYHPMAVPEPTTDDRVEALQVEMKVMKDWINKHSRSHTGRDAI
jgi:hypothetical protein